MTAKYFSVTESIQCYDCIKDHPIHPKKCPGQLLNFQSSTACRISTLGDGTVIEQTVTPTDLCDDDDIQRFLLGIARKYRVGNGEKWTYFDNFIVHNAFREGHMLLH